MLEILNDIREKYRHFYHHFVYSYFILLCNEHKRKKNTWLLIYINTLHLKHGNHFEHRSQEKRERERDIDKILCQPTKHYCAIWMLRDHFCTKSWLAMVHMLLSWLPLIFSIFHSVIVLALLGFFFFISTWVASSAFSFRNGTRDEQKIGYLRRKGKKSQIHIKCCFEVYIWFYN